MVETLKPDICVIGSGAGGLSVAAAAAAFGVPVVLIERHKMGGDCLNTGCVPSKALLAAAKRAETMRAAAPFGVTAQAIKVDFAKVHDHVQRVIGAIAPTDSAERFGGLGVRVIKGHAKFKDRKTVVSATTTKSARAVSSSRPDRRRRCRRSRGSTRVLISPTKPFSISPNGPTVSSLSAPVRSAWKWRKPSAGSAAR